MDRLFLAFIFLFLYTAKLSAIPKADDIETKSNLKKVTVSGKVIDTETTQPLEYATISFLDAKDNKLVDGTITDMNGLFEIKIPSGIYNVKIEYISYKPLLLNEKSIDNDLNLGTIALDLDVEALDAVEVIAEKTTVEIRLDKKIYNVCSKIRQKQPRCFQKKNTFVVK